MKDDDVLATAKARFERCLSYSAEAREKARNDLKFVAASPDDPWQWDDRDYKARKVSQRPALTINKMPQHVRQVTNDIRQNRPSIRFRPADNKADPKVADILMGVVRHIEANSDADVAYDTAADHQVAAGEGFIRVMADYCREDSFDQDIFIKRVKNPFRVHLDPDIQDPVGSDARFAFVEDLLTSEEYKAEFPGEEEIDWTNTSEEGGWFDRGTKKVRICEYFSVEDSKATLILWDTGATSYEGDPKPEGASKKLKTRPATKRQVIWRKINGAKVLDTKPFPSRFIPIARVVGNEWEVEGKGITSGIVRNAKDSQRMYNMAQSAIVERVMQAPKAPWAVAAESIESFEGVWRTANTANHAYLPYNHKDADGQLLPSPQRVAPASVEPGLTEVARSASDDIKAETGQYDASLGAKSNETSGRAILARQREGDTSTYHFVDNLSRAVRHVGRIILDMYPKIYDTKRVAQIIGEDNSSTSAILDPEQQEPLSEIQDEQGAVVRTFNPFIGLYDVFTTTGPSFTTRRLEAVQAMTEMTQGNPQLWGVIGDQLVKNMDWPGAEEMAERLRVTLVPPVQQMLDQEQHGGQIPPQAQAAMAQMQQQMQQMQMQLQQASQLADQNRVKYQIAAMQRDIDLKKLSVDEINAQTARMKVQADIARESMKGDHVAMTQDAKTAHVAIAEQAKQDTAIAVAEIDGDARRDVAAIQAFTQLEIASIQPPPQITQEATEGDQE